MMKNKFTWFVCISFLLLQLPIRLTGQVLVDRCKALDQASPIHNIWVDEDNIKWVANSQGLNKVLSLDIVEKVSIPAGTTSLLTIRGGNAKLEWSTSEIQNVIGTVTLTCASYDPKTKTVWLGTQQSGAFQITVSPLHIIQRLNTDNRKLTSNQVNDIFIASNGTTYIATNDGMLIGSGDRWTLEERYLNFVGVDAWGQNLWILGDDFLWQVDSKGKWSPIAIELKNVEGQLRDIAVDQKGRVWIASNMMTGYDVNADKYQRFGPGQYFTSQFVNCLDVDKDGSIWTGTADKGLYLIQWESSMIISIELVSPLDCKSSEPSASLYVKVAGGQQPYTYLWNTGQTTPDISKLSLGDYILTVTDAKGATKTGKYQIIDPSIKLSAAQVSPSSGSALGDGSANIVATGGTGQYIIHWDNGESTMMATKLTTGVHTVTVSDKAGCAAITNVTIKETLMPLTVSLSTLKENKCADGYEGQLKVEIKGGKAPYQYNWSTNSGTDITSPNLKPGLYSVSVSDAAGQTATATAVLSAPAPVLASIELLLAASVNSSNGQAQVKASGGKSPYTYAWTNGEKSALLKNLTAGTHQVTVTDVNGCSEVASIIMTENILPINASIVQLNQIMCNNTVTASLKVDATGGKSPYHYKWSNGKVTSTIEDLTAGNYEVTVTDAVGTSFIAALTISQPDAILVGVKVDGAASTNGSDGKASITVTGGTGKYTYLWDNGEKTSKAEKLPAGTHSLTVTDENGCTSSGNLVITENILPLSVKISQVDKITCAGQNKASLKAEVTGGKQPFSYSWSGAGTELTGETIHNLTAGAFTLKVTDVTGISISNQFEIPEPKALKVTADDISPASTGNADGYVMLKASGGTTPYSYNGKVWPTGSNSLKVENLGPGDYQLKISDASGCSAEANVKITEDILPLSVSIRQTKQILCPGALDGLLEGSAKGGKPPYNFSWGNGQNGATLSNAGEGMYTLNVTDASGQKSSADFRIAGPVPMTLEITNLRSATNDRLNDGKGTVQVKGGASPYLYSWGSGESTIQAVRLPIGSSQVIVTDQNGCSASVEYIINEKVLPELTAARLTSGEPIRMEKIQFEADSVKVYPEAIPSLDELYEFLYDNPTIIIEVSGHTNGLPADDYCDRISSERAKSVADYLLNKGIETRRVISKGYGKRKPVATNQTPEGRKKNQRVEIRLIKIEE